MEIVRPLFGGFLVQALVVVVSVTAIPELYFTVLPSSVTVQRGDSAIIPCAAAGIQPITTSWRRGREALPEPSGKTQILLNGSLVLRLSEDEPACTRTGYQCCVTNPNGTLCSPAVSVTSTEPPSRPVVNPSDLKVVENGSIRLECLSTAPGPHPFRWEKDGELLGRDDRYTFLPTGVLQITPASPADTGEYRCLTGDPATLLTTSESSGVTVVVGEPSSGSDGRNGTGSRGEGALILGQLGDVTTGSSVEQIILECLAAGSWVDIVWRRNGVKPLPRGRSRYLGNKNLELREPAPADSGTYTCEATHAKTGQTASRNATVNVREYSAPVFTEVPASLTAPYFTTVRLSCCARGRPAPRIAWFLNGEPTKTRLLTSEDVGDDNNLVIWNADRVHTGIYQCVASNALGTVQTSAHLTVVVPLNIPDPPYNLTTHSKKSTEIVIMWQADVGLSVFSLHYYKEPDGEETQRVIVDQPLNTYTVMGLVPYTNYTFYMRAYTTKASGISDRVLGQTAEGVPLVAPDFVLTSRQANTIVVQWEAIANKAQRRGRVVKYQICYQDSELLRLDTCREVGSSESNFTIRGLQPSTFYDIRMAAATSKGFGPESSVQSIITADSGNCSAPAVHPLVVALNDTSLVVSWSAQNESGQGPAQGPAQGFQLSLSWATHDDVLDLPARSFSYVFAGLVPGEHYSVELIPYNACGSGSASTAMVTVPTVDGLRNPPPENVRATALSPTRIQLNWNPVPGFRRPYYKVVYFQNSDRRKGAPTELYSVNTYAVLDGLKPNTIYAFQVCLQQSGIVCQFSDSVFARTLEDVPSEPRDLRAFPVDAHAVRIEWRPPVHPNGVIQSYNIMYLPSTRQTEEEMDGQKAPHWSRSRQEGTMTSATIRNLTSDTSYYFFLRACTSVGEGEPSTVLLVKTPRETSLNVSTGTSNNPDERSATEKGLFIGILLGTLCIVLCTVLAGIRYKRYRNNHTKKMASWHNGQAGQLVPALRPSRGNSVEMATTSLSSVPPREVPTRQPNGQAYCELPLLGPDECPAAERSESDERQQQQQQQQQQPPARHPLPGTFDGEADASSSPTESASDDGSGTPHRWTPLRLSTSGDSGLIADVEFAAETSPQLVEKVLREHSASLQQV